MAMKIFRAPSSTPGKIYMYASEFFVGNFILHNFYLKRFLFWILI